MSGMKRRLSLLLAFLMIAVSVFGNSTISYAGGMEDEWGDGNTSAITKTEITSFWDEDGFYPASFEYVMRNFQLKVTYEDGQSETISYWSPSWIDSYGCYQAYGNYGMDTYYAYFYDAAGNRVEVSEFETPIGTFVMKILKNGTELLAEKEVTILEPEIGTVSGSTAKFTCDQSKKYEETWYPVDLAAEKQYMFYANTLNPMQNSLFVSAWVKNSDGTVSKVNNGTEFVGIDTLLMQYQSNGKAVYFVVGETYFENSVSGEFSWNEKKVISSFKVKPAAAYKAWDGDIYTIPLEITYTDGTKETYDNWHDYGTYDGMLFHDSYELETKNGDEFFISAYEGEQQVDCVKRSDWLPGEYTYKVYNGADPDVKKEFKIEILDFETESLTLKEGTFEDFSVSSSNFKYFTFNPNGSVDIDLTNNGPGEMRVYYFYEKSYGGEGWEEAGSAIIGTGATRSLWFSTTQQALCIVTADQKSTGSIGLHVDAQIGTAEVLTKEVDSSDLTAWSKLPIQVNYVCSDGVTSAGSQKITNWSPEYGVAYAYTKNYEYICYALYKGEKQVEVPVLSSEMAEWLEGAETDEEREAILAELGAYMGVSSLEVPDGEYTLKVYKDSVSDENQIASAKIKVVDKSVCTEHTWDKGTVSKKATSSAVGKLLYTCTRCGETKTSTIQKIGTVKLAATKYTYDGEVKKPKLTVKDAKGNTISSSYYTATYATGRKAVGEYKVTVKFKGRYSGTKELSFTIVPKAPSLSSVTAGGRSFTAKWKKVTAQATGYQIYYATKKDFSNAKKVFVTSASTVSKKISSLTAGTKYYVKVRTYKTVDGEKIYSAWSTVKTVVPNPVSTSLTSVTAGGRSFTAKWKKATSQTSGYQIQYATNSSFKSAKSVTVSGISTVSKKVTGLTAGTKYYVRVRAYRTVDGTKYYSAWSSAKTVTPNPVSTTLKSVTAGSKKMTVKWNKVSAQVTGYQIQYATSSSFKSAQSVKVAKAGTVSKEIKGLKKGKKYYVRIRTYRVVSGKTYYSSWSTNKTVTVK